jgi:DNA-directed RNA polymerase specialized sigma24 family protein
MPQSMETTVPTTLKSFFAGVAGERATSGALSEALTSIARHLTRGCDADADDVVGDFLLKLVTATRRGSPGSAAYLLHLEEPELRAVVRHRMRQLLAERSPHHHVVKQLRAAVRSALRRGLPIAPLSPPTALLFNDRLHGPTVAAATAWLLAGPDAPLVDDVAAIAETLRTLYFDLKASGSPEDGDVPVDPVDTNRLVAQLHARLDAGQLAVLRERLRGGSLAEVGAHVGVGLSTAHARVSKAVAVVRKAVAEVDAETGEAALDLLAA